MGLVKFRTLADGAVDLVGQFRSRQGIEIRLHGPHQRGRRIRKLSENGLAAYDHEVVLVCDAPCGADQVFKIGTPHTPVHARWW